MRCDKCAREEAVLKTCRQRDGEGTGVLCDSCWFCPRDLVWIVAGLVPAHGRCRGCSCWFSVRELSVISQGGKWDAPSGICPVCVR